MHHYRIKKNLSQCELYISQLIRKYKETVDDVAFQWIALGKIKK